MFEKTHITCILVSLPRSRRDNCQIATDNILLHTHCSPLLSRALWNLSLEGGLCCFLVWYLACFTHAFSVSFQTASDSPQQHLQYPSFWKMNALLPQRAVTKIQECAFIWVLITLFGGVCLHFLSLWYSSDLWVTIQSVSLRSFPPQNCLLFHAILPLLRSAFP